MSSSANDEMLREVVERGKRAGIDLAPFINRGFGKTQLEEIVRGIKAGVNPNLYDDPTKPVRIFWELRQTEITQKAQQQISLPSGDVTVPTTESKPPQSEAIKIEPLVEVIVKESPVGTYYALGEIRLKGGPNENYADVGVCRVGTPIRIIEAADNGWLKTETGAFVARCVLTRTKPPQEGAVTTTKREKEAAMNVFQLHQIYLAQTAHQNISLFAVPEFTAPQMHEIRLGLQFSIYAAAYANAAIPAAQMREIRIAMQSGFSPTSDIYNDLLIFNMRQIAERYGYETTLFRGKTVSKEQAEEICRARQAGIGEEIYLILNAELSAPQMHEIWLGIFHNVDVSSYAEVDFLPEQMREIRLEQEKAQGKKKMVMHRIGIQVSKWKTANLRRKNNIVRVAVDSEFDRSQLSLEDLVFVNNSNLTTEQADMLMFALASTKDESARLLMRPEAIRRVLNKVKNKFTAEDFLQLAERLSVK